ncbi:MAG: 4-deoxy-4-formamido-L-arabinose-phosphoundecaprenol deformylase [Planctomycetes bacterium]|nr:4-deoxy-4-formamido-L-arabinose-phosphoundecaprenol deformylase [Planctomycetota bacterium]MBI3844962.1 4-deoxy-4-formamido-L-arabinose-phosphoundecaprenol deformylase [Planctomycetota bacterium]
MTVAPPGARVVAIKVDVDTYRGARDGIPRLLRALEEARARATFFVTFGPDHSGRAVLRVFTRKGFLKKMLRTNATKTYGLSTMLSGTLLPGKLVGAGCPDLLRDIDAAGHEVGIHGWNHVRWHDRLFRMTKDEVREEYRRAVDAYVVALGRPPKSVAAPAWRCTAESLSVQDEMNLLYASDPRGTEPFFPRIGSQTFRTIQVPTTFSTLDEMLGRDGVTENNVHEALLREWDPSRLAVHTIHTEGEGSAYLDSFRRWLALARERGAEFERLDRIVPQWLAQPSDIPVCEVVRKEIPGRAGEVCVQESTAVEAAAHRR